jgi:hypothetical protein
MVNEIGNQEAEYGISQELHGLVVEGVVFVGLMGVGFVRDSLLQQISIAKDVVELFL